MSRATRRVEPLLPSSVALVFTAERGWHVRSAPPAWWLEEREEPVPQQAASATVAPVMTSCRPGRGRPVDDATYTPPRAELPGASERPITRS